MSQVFLNHEGRGGGSGDEERKSLRPRRLGRTIVPRPPEEPRVPATGELRATHQRGADDER